MSGEFNGLYATKTRLALLRAIREGNGRIYFEAGDVFDKATYTRVTARVKEFIQHGWVRALAPDEARGPGETSAPGVTYYRLTSLGAQALGLKSSTEEKSA